MNRRLLAISPVDHPGGAETTLLRLLAGLKTADWTITLTTPGHGPLRTRLWPPATPGMRLPLGGLARGTGARAIASWPRARALARKADVVYLNGAVCGRLLPALPRRTGARLVLHVHDMVNRVPRFWRRAERRAGRLPGRRRPACAAWTPTSSTPRSTRIHPSKRRHGRPATARWSASSGGSSRARARSTSSAPRRRSAARARAPASSSSATTPTAPTPTTRARCSTPARSSTTAGATTPPV